MYGLEGAIEKIYINLQLLKWIFEMYVLEVAIQKICLNLC